MAVSERRSKDHIETITNWAREAATIIAAAGAAYMGIRVDLARNQSDIEMLKIQQVKIEAHIEKIRDAQLQGVGK
jgi:hypothetical protein